MFKQYVVNKIIGYLEEPKPPKPIVHNISGFTMTCIECGDIYVFDKYDIPPDHGITTIGLCGSEICLDCWGWLDCNNCHEWVCGRSECQVCSNCCR